MSKERKIVYPVLVKSFNKGPDPAYGGVNLICPRGARLHCLECSENTGETFMKKIDSYVKNIEEFENEKPTLQPSNLYKQCFLNDEWQAWSDFYYNFMLTQKMNIKKKKVYPVLAKHMGPDEVYGGVTTIFPDAVITHWIGSPGNNGEKLMERVDSKVKIIETLIEKEEPTSLPNIEYKRSFLQDDWQPWDDFYSTFMLSEMMKKKLTVGEKFSPTFI